MADTRDKVGRAGVFLAGGVFKTAVYIFIIVFLSGLENQHISLATMCLTSRL